MHPWALCPSPPKDQECPQHLDRSAGTGVKSGPLPAVRPLLLWAPFFCCASFARRTSVLWCQLKVCQLSHAVAVVPYRVTCCYRENFGSITFPAVLPKLWLLIYPTPPHPSQIRDHLSSLCRIPSDFSAPLLSWLEGTGHKIRWTHPNPPVSSTGAPSRSICWAPGVSSQLVSPFCPGRILWCSVTHPSRPQAQEQEFHLLVFV